MNDLNKDSIDLVSVIIHMGTYTREGDTIELHI